MKILVEIGHPAHVHFFKHAIEIWKERGHELVVAARKKEMALSLLRAHRIESICLSRAGRGISGLMAEMLARDFRLWRLVRCFQPDVMTSIGGTWISHVSKITGRPAVVFYDTENARTSNAITYPFVSALCTPRCYLERTGLGQRHLCYPGYHELAYLRPDYFQPDPETASFLQFSGREKCFLLRFISWKAGHDLSESGLTLGAKRYLVDMLKPFGRVFISSEAPLPEDLQAHSLPVPAHSVHDLMARSTLVIGESATMASEAAVLGIPAVFISDTGRGYIKEQEERYGLVYHYTNRQTEQAFRRIERLIEWPDLLDRWKEKRKAMLNDTIDVTSFVVDFIENFPESLSTYRRKWASIQQEGGRGSRRDG